MLAQDLKQKSITIVTHEFFKGSGQELRDYLVKSKVNTLNYIAHLFYFSKTTSVSYHNRFEKGKLVLKRESVSLPKNEFLLYLRDFFYNLYYLFTIKGTIDLYVGVNSFNALFGLFFKKLGKVKKVAFFTIDYVMDNRFKSNLLNTLYIKMDRIAFFNSDYTLNVSDRMSRQRIKELGERAKSKTQLAVPIGIIQEAKSVKAKKQDNLLVYSGSIEDGFGLDLVINAMPNLVKKIPDVRLRIIGDGTKLASLKARAKELEVESNIEFVGHIDTSKNRNKWIKLLKESTLGLCPYDDTEDTYKQFSDVTKPKDYISCGLPVITTSVIPISEDITKLNLGRVVNDDIDSYVTEIVKLLKNKNEILEIQKNVAKYAVNYSWESIFDRLFKELVF